MPVLFDGFSEISESEKAVWNRIMLLLRRSSRIKQLTFNPRNEKFCAFNILLNVLDEVIVEDLVIPAISNLSESIGFDIYLSPTLSKPHNQVENARCSESLQHQDLVHIHSKS